MNKGSIGMTSARSIVTIQPSNAEKQKDCTKICLVNENGNSNTLCNSYIVMRIEKY